VWPENSAAFQRHQQCFPLPFEGTEYAGSRSLGSFRMGDVGIGVFPEAQKNPCRPQPPCAAVGVLTGLLYNCGTCNVHPNGNGVAMLMINEIPEQECREVLARAPVARLGCALDNQPYVVPINFAYDGQYMYVFSTVGKKIEWMRANPKVCIQTDIQIESEWVSVIVNGRYEELAEPQYTAERKHASRLLAKRYQWWLNALAQRRMTLGDSSIEPLFFRIYIDSMTGLRAAERT
jgi:uncharacterized protein